MKQIPLTQGKFSLVDDEDFERLDKFKWSAHEEGKSVFYARKWRKGNAHDYMHTLILEVSPGFEIDHIDGNGLNNQKSNLRVVTHRKNQQNLHIRKSSRFPGVTWNKQKGRWMAQIKITSKNKYLGLFDTEEDAFAAYKKAVDEVGVPA